MGGMKRNTLASADVVAKVGDVLSAMLAITAGAVIAFVGFVTVAHGAYYMEYEGVKGESTESSSGGSTGEVRTTSTNTGTVEVKAIGATVTGSATADIDVEVTGAGRTSTGEPEEIDVRGTVKVNTANGVMEVKLGDDEGEAKGKVEYEWKVEEGESVSVSAAQVRGWDDATKKEFIEGAKAHAELASQQDLENFAKGILIEDEVIEDVVFEEKEMRVTYKNSGKLFGFIPLSFNEEVVASAEEGAELAIAVKSPWYAFLVKRDISGDEVAQEAKKKHRETIQIESWSFGASNSGSLLKTISNVLKAKHDTLKSSKQ